MKGPDLGKLAVLSCRALLAVIVISLTCGSLPSAAIGQSRPINDYGALGLGRLLKRLNTTASVMMIGAHPDDEDSALLAYLARGENARTAYLSLTRGDGGQNIIGPELFESLGVIRTEELLQARRLDGAEQYFTRAFDYGFSKTLSEAKAKWDEKVVLCDAVRAIRLFRPLVVISRFTGTPLDGHGQHQFAGYISPLAVAAAGDAGQCTTSGAAWQVPKFYVGQSFRDSSQPGIRINTGAYDPMLGRTYFEIAMEGRSQHRSQGEGRIEFHGEQFSGLNRVRPAAAATAPERSIFDGLDISLSGIDDIAVTPDAGLANELTLLEAAAAKALREYRSIDPPSSLPALMQLAKAIDRAVGVTRNSEVLFRLSQKRSEVGEAIRNAAGIQVDALADRETVVPGEDVFAAIKVYFPNEGLVRVKDITISTPQQWTVAKAAAPKDGNQAFNIRETARAAEFFTLGVPGGAAITEPYWLRDPRDGDLFRWPEADHQTLPFQPADVSAIVKLDVDGYELSVRTVIQHRSADPSRGELRRNVDVVTGISVGVDHRILIVPYSSRDQVRRLTMSVTKNSDKPLEASWASLNTGATTEWPVVPGMKPLTLTKRGEQTSIPFDLTIPAGTRPGIYNISPHVAFREAIASTEMNTISYPHIQTHRFYTRVETMVNVLDIKTVPLKVGYIMGSGDAVPEAIRQLGYDLTMLEEKDLGTGDLSRFDTIVVGIRASETRPDMVANNQRLIDFVRDGGDLVTQYQRPPFARLNLTPFPVSTDDTQKTAAGSTARVVDENARVAILLPDHPVFNFPNKITTDDFNGWVQERNLYNLTTFDERFTPLLESHDAGEAENKGGLVVAKVGKGTYTYVSYSFFRQLPAGVSGAYRLFANILSQSKVKR